MSPQPPTSIQGFAKYIVTKLRSNGYEAYFAGGCVRDQLLGVPPKDYDVATSALPNQIRSVFGNRRTINVGAAFGVITVLAPKNLGQIEVATFRQDGEYLDGRHPATVEFCSSKEDALRRDFTINGMFLDPVANQVIDYVGGQKDLKEKTICCIGDPRLRFGEDKLRMLRAVRFAARLGFKIEDQTLASIQNGAGEIHVVSRERIANEMRTILCHDSRSEGLLLLRQSKLRPFILPEFSQQEEAWEKGLDSIRTFRTSRFECALAGLVLYLANPLDAAQSIADRWRLSNDERNLIMKLLRYESLLGNASKENWPTIQRILIEPDAEDFVAFTRHMEFTQNRSLSGVEFCEAKLLLPADQLNPTPLIDGDEIKRLGIPAGPHFRILLETIRDMQLRKELTSSDSAVEAVQLLWAQMQDKNPD